MSHRFEEIEAELDALSELRDKPAGTIRITADEHAARELGLNPSTCAGWVRKAGLRSRASQDVRYPRREGHPRRGEYFELRSQGVPRREAVRRVGVNERTARDWDRGIRKSNGRRIHPDGRVVGYKRGMTNTIEKAALRAAEAFRGERPISARFLTLQERERLRDLHRDGLSLRRIAVGSHRAHTEFRMRPVDGL